MRHQIIFEAVKLFLEHGVFLLQVYVTRFTFCVLRLLHRVCVAISLYVFHLAIREFGYLGGISRTFKVSSLASVVDMDSFGLGTCNYLIKLSGLLEHRLLLLWFVKDTRLCVLKLRLLT